MHNVARLSGGERQPIRVLKTGARLTRQASTKHLRMLESSGILRSSREGREQLFEFRPQPIDAVQKYLGEIALRWDRALNRLKRFVEAEGAACSAAWVTAWDCLAAKLPSGEAPGRGAIRRPRPLRRRSSCSTLRGSGHAVDRGRPRRAPTRGRSQAPRGPAGGPRSRGRHPRSDGRFGTRRERRGPRHVPAARPRSSLAEPRPEASEYLRR
jgi:hypothetical protein